MSLCLFIMDKDSIYIGTDSAITIDGRRSTYALQKINQLNDGNLLFICGTVEASIKINRELSQYSTVSIELLQNVLREKLVSELSRDELLKEKLDEGKEAISAILFTKNREVYLFPSKNNFDVQLIQCEPNDNNVNIYGAGYDAQKAYDEAVRLLTSKNGYTPTFILNKAFEHVAGAEVGGDITITRIDDRGVHMSAPRKINEVLRYEITDQPLVSSAHAIASEITGGTIKGANISTNQGVYPYCELSSDANVFRAAKSANSYIEIEANPVTYNSAALKFVNGGTTAVHGLMGNNYYTGISGGDYDISTSMGNIRILAGTGYNVIINNLRPQNIDLSTANINGLLQSDVSGLVSRLMSIESSIASLSSRVSSLEST